MKDKILITILTLGAITGYLLIGNQYKSQTNSSHLLMFQNWMKDYGKHYLTYEQFKYRYQVYLDTLLSIQQHNKLYDKGESTYFLKVNQFSDLTHQQFKQNYLQTYTPSKQQAISCNGPQAPFGSLPSSFNWVTVGGVTPVKDIKTGCNGGSWAVAAAQAVQGHKYRATGRLTQFSEQQLIDCSKNDGNDGCNKGTMPAAYTYYIDKGVATRSLYPYAGKVGTCIYSITMKMWQIGGCTIVTPDNELLLRGAVYQQPVSTLIDASIKAFQSYSGGIFSSTLCRGSNANHGVLITGYGEEGTNKFWNIKNSWGTSWGQKGYIRVLRNDKKGGGQCGIYLHASFPIS